MSSQWDNFLKNLGTWRGSFSTMSLNGEISSDVPSILTLALVDGDRDCVRLHLQRFESGDYDSEASSNMTQDFRSLGRHMIFSETGSFSKGVMWFSTMMDFIAEFGFIAGDRRLRMVQIYDEQYHFEKLVFIREFREGTNAKERPQLTVDQLVGTWEAESQTYRPDFEPPKISQSRLKLNVVGETLHQSIELDNRTITIQAQIEGNQLKFNSDVPRQITLLPDGGSINVPLQVPSKKAFFVEVGWLVSDNIRQRIMRNFDEQGKWESSVFITEKRVG
ncbi:hypothetical protein Lepto7376_4194 [[Leptolyngbya] sp. PCC 7376]|uniref:DUF3598 family protein n=1 Tax=[Leptolyngbya] sp. PCC 7376 TaxID=111781 RepID=UPI00029EF9C6|nr:DUF3598 family protein [[Leptolyngbya] sp. PCC 7376]AFY40314.1 hypothetical protein Lepto7376_4194 [[Leptolyngbya] sp. PCC 7376]